MIYTWTLVLLLAVQPFPTIALLMEFKTREICEETIKVIDLPNEQRTRLACMQIAHESI